MGGCHLGVGRCKMCGVVVVNFVVFAFVFPPEYALVAPTKFGPLQASEYDGANLCLIVWVSADLGLISRFYVCIHAYMYICIRAQLKNKSFEREQ